MAQSWPWLQESDRFGSAGRISARVRFHEAIAEARSSLELFSDPLQSPGRPVAGLLHLQRFCAEGVEAGRERARRTAGRLREQARARLARRTFSWNPRLLAHGSLIAVLVILYLAGGFQGVLAQSVQSGSSAGDFAQRGHWSSGDAEGLQSAYAAIPAMPLVLQRPRLFLEEAFPEDMGGPAAAIQRTEVITYTVQKGDTLVSIAVQHGVSVETIYWYNELKSADMLSIDQDLRIPPVDGLRYEVKAGDTLDSIAEAFKVRTGNLIAYAPNSLREPYALVAGEILFVPGASKAIPQPPAVTIISSRPFRLTAPTYASLPGGERFSWPTSGRITDRFGWTGYRWHNGLDIAAPLGTPIYSSAAGTVTTAGWQQGYGYMVEIDHGDSWKTRYGHMAYSPEVGVGQWVERGQLIGFIGCTGNCTGPHVHFEIIHQGSNANPLDYLQ